MRAQIIGCLSGRFRRGSSPLVAGFAAAVFAALMFFLPGSATAQSAVRPLKEKIASGWFLFDSQGCSSCHMVMGKGGALGPDLTYTTMWASPILGAAVMWNHVPLMAKARQERGLGWPDFKAEEIGDIFIYLRSLNRRVGGQFSFPADALIGEVRFTGTCKMCHGPPFKGGNIGPDLGPIVAEMNNEEEFATRMLRHAPKMILIARRKGIPWPQLTGSEMGGIFVYLKSITPLNRK